MSNTTTPTTTPTTPITSTTTDISTAQTTSTPSTTSAPGTTSTPSATTSTSLFGPSSTGTAGRNTTTSSDVAIAVSVSVVGFIIIIVVIVVLIIKRKRRQQIKRNIPCLPDPDTPPWAPDPDDAGQDIRHTHVNSSSATLVTNEELDSCSDLPKAPLPPPSVSTTANYMYINTNTKKEEKDDDEDNNYLEPSEWAGDTPHETENFYFPMGGGGDPDINLPNPSDDVIYSAPNYEHSPKPCTGSSRRYVNVPNTPMSKLQDDAKIGTLPKYANLHNPYSNGNSLPHYTNMHMQSESLPNLNSKSYANTNDLKPQQRQINLPSPVFRPKVLTKPAFPVIKGSKSNSCNDEVIVAEDHKDSENHEYENVTKKMNSHINELSKILYSRKPRK